MNMDIANKWLMLAANLGVLAGILFLAIEINQNNEQLKIQTSQKHIDLRLSNIRVLYEDGMVSGAFFKAGNGEELSDLEQFKLERFYSATTIAWRWNFDQYQLGYHDSFPATQIVNTYNNWPGMKEYRESGTRPESDFDHFLETGELNR